MFSIGVDDAARGSLAGPIIYCAFVCNKPEMLLRAGVRDSKVTSREGREAFLYRLQELEAKYWISIATPEMVNKTGYFTAEGSRIKALTGHVIRELGINPKKVHLLMDGTAEFVGMPTGATLSYISQGDQKEPLISGASMLAKLTHDLLVEEEIHPEYPDWGFDSHRCYGSPQHVEKLYKCGPTPIHRLGPCITAIKTYCKKKGCSLPKWMKQ